MRTSSSLWVRHLVARNPCREQTKYSAPSSSAAPATKTSTTTHAQHGNHDEHWRASCYGNRARLVREGAVEKGSNMNTSSAAYFTSCPIRREAARKRTYRTSTSPCGRPIRLAQRLPPAATLLRTPRDPQSTPSSTSPTRSSQRVASSDKAGALTAGIPDHAAAAKHQPFARLLNL
jgi:hypothetical protein